MTWHVYRLTYRLLSPLHAGFHKVGNLQRTRRYVPGQTATGAVVARLAAALGYTEAADYTALRQLAAAHLLIGYFYPAFADLKPIVPWYDDERGLIYAVAPDPLNAEPVPPAEDLDLDRLLVAGWTSTAIVAGGRTAEEGSLHEVEYLMPRTRSGDQVYLTGRVYVREGEATLRGRLLRVGSEDVTVETGAWSRALFREVLGDIQIGGERRYGFGRASYASSAHITDEGFDGTGERPSQQIAERVPFPAHVDARSCPGGRGVIEPLVGRQTLHADRFGQQVTAARICWAPGSTLDSLGTFEVHPDGILVQVNPSAAQLTGSVGKDCSDE